MNQLATKTKLVFIPLIILGVIFIITYSFLYWIFYIRLNLTPLKEDVVQYWIPVSLSFLSVILLIRPRIHILKLDRDNGRIRGLYYLVGSAVFCIPTVIALNYLDAATGKLTVLNSIKEISGRSPTRYYKIDSYVLNKDGAGVESGMSYSGRHNEHLDLNIYVVIPFTAELSDTLQSPSAFLSLYYHKQIPGKTPKAERREQWSIFWDESFRTFDSEPLHFVYLERMPNTDDRDNFIIAAKNSSLYRPKSATIILKPIDKPFEKRNGHRLGYIFLSFGIGALVWFVMVIIPGLHENKARNFVSANRNYLQKEINAAYNVFKLKPGFTATPILIGLNTLVFLIMVLKGLGFLQFYTRDLIPWGAIFQPAVQQGQWWRLVTGMFLHGGIMHLLMNMFSLYLVGLFLEGFMGSKKFAIGYLITGIAAGLISIAWHSKPVVAVGASGAIFGLYGILLSLVFTRKLETASKKFMLIFLACTAGYSLLMGFLSAGIDNSAHVGGLVAGLIFGAFFAKRVKQTATII